MATSETSSPVNIDILGSPEKTMNFEKQTGEWGTEREDRGQRSPDLPAREPVSRIHML